LARKTALRKPSRGLGIISRKPRLKSAYYFLGLLYCFIVLLCVLFCLPSLHDIFPTTICAESAIKQPANKKKQIYTATVYNNTAQLCPVDTRHCQRHMGLGATADWCT